MSPEMELLDQLLGGDEPLWLALMVFGWPAPAALEQAKHALWMMVQEGIIDMYCVSGSAKHILKDWEVRHMLAIDSNWLLQGEQAVYFLRLTNKGVQYTGYNR